MWIKNLQLTNFRNYKKGKFDFSPTTNLIIGANAIGKTNLLEAIYLLNSGTSFKADVAAQMINWEADFGVIEGRVVEKEEENTLLIQLQKGKGRITKKTFLINGVEKSRKLFLPYFFAVSFRPEDIRLVSGPPDRRRRLLDEILSSLDWRYQSSLRQYTRALKQRNGLLDEIKERKASLSELFYWDNALVKNGQFLVEERRKMVAFINHYLSLFPHSFLQNMSLNYQPNPVTLENLKRSLKKDVYTGWTNVGPHKDILVVESSQFKTSDKNIAFWGSRAQQRLSVLGLKLAQLEYVYEQTKRRPILLLDDIFSELDLKQQKLLKTTFERHQVIVTSARIPNKKIFKWEKEITLSF